MKVKESGKVGLKLSIQKTKIMASGPFTSWEVDGETVETIWQATVRGVAESDTTECAIAKGCESLLRERWLNVSQLSASLPLPPGPLEDTDPGKSLSQPLAELPS